MTRGKMKRIKNTSSIVRQTTSQSLEGSGTGPVYVVITLSGLRTLQGVPFVEDHPDRWMTTKYWLGGRDEDTPILYR